MATLGQIFGQQRQGFQQFLEPDKAKPTQAFISSAGTLNRQMTPAPQAPTQTPFVRRTPTPVQTPVAPNVPAPTPTIGQTYRNFNAPSLSGEDSELDRALKLQANEARKLATTPVDEEQTRREIMDMYQAQIDAINNIYAQQAAEARQQGLGTLGSTRAIQARSGLIGSDFGAAQTANVEKQNADIIRSIESEKGAKISALIGEGKQRAVEEIANKRKAMQEGLQSYVSYLGAQTERRQTKLAGLAQALIDQGVRPDELNPKQIEELAKSYGVNPQDISSAYTSRERELLASQGADGFTLAEGQERYEFNPATGGYQLVAAGAPKIGSSSTGKMTDSQAKAATFAARMLDSNSIIDGVGDQFASLGAYVGQNLPNPLKSAERQMFEQAKRNFINAVLRRESGAVISPEEFKNAEQQYFPQPGDTPEVLAQKKQNRETSYQGMQNEAGTLSAQGGSQTSFGSGFAEEW
jgi:hypothetical protein